MNKNIYFDSMQRVKFSEDFNNKTIAAMEKAIKSSHKTKNKFRWRYAALPAAALGVFAMVMAFIPVFQGNESQSADTHNTVIVTPQISSPDISDSKEQSKYIVVSSDYSGNTLDSLAAQPGTVTIAEEVQNAMNDTKNSDGLFYVAIHATLPENESEKYSVDNYEYNGRTIAEWSILAALAANDYPYNEYKKDFGEDITEEEWKQAISNAKALDAEENYDNAIKAYNDDFAAILDRVLADWQESEYMRLKEEGFDVFLSDISGNEKVLTGLLTIEQLQNFPADSKSAYSIEWVRDKNGIVDWGNN